jgi:acetyltransferase-like isoleucine patch superfamily enzyme
VRDFRAFSYGTGRFERSQFKSIGENVVIEDGVLVFRPETISIGSNVYIGHRAILRGYERHELVIGSNTWIGQLAYINSAGGVEIGSNVGIGPCVKIMTSSHAEEGRLVPVLLSALEFAPVKIEDETDIGIGAIILPGVTIGKGAIVGAGAVVTHDVAPFSIVAGVPARPIGERPPDAP